jgi:hypothetical protein
MEIAAISTPTSAVPSRDVAETAVRDIPAAAIRDIPAATLRVAAAAVREIPAAGVRDAADPLDARVLIGVDIGCLVVTAALAVVVLLGAEGTARLMLALAFTSVVPGWALVRRLGLAGTATGAAMAVPTSLAICAGASVVMVWIHAWQPLTLFVALAAVSAGVIGWMLRIQIAGLTRATPILGR